MSRRTTSAAVVLTALALALSGCQDGERTALPVAGSATSSPVSPVPAATGAASATPSPTASATPAATPSPSASPAPGHDVLAVQRTLQRERYYAGPLDGRTGPALRSALMAFQKVQGIGVDGAVGPQTLAALATPRPPVLKGGGPADRVEVDLTKQVLYVVEDGAVARVLPISSGNGATYSQKSGGTARALTPTGWYTIGRRIVGVRNADLGTLYDPQYFYRGWAIHGSNSVPAGPASHGCVRVTRADATYLLKAIGVGTKVHLYGGTHVFRAGSDAAGTDTPTGDTAGGTAGATPTAAPAAPTPAPTTAAPARPSATPAPPSPSPRPAAPTASPTRGAPPSPPASTASPAATARATPSP